MNLGNKAVINIHVFGDNNVIIIDKVRISKQLRIDIGLNHKNFGKVVNHQFEIGRETSIEDMWYCSYNSNSYCSIGKNCMISFDVILYNTDAHPVMDTKTMKLINKVKGISIGNHCWIGQKASILKNTIIPNDCIIGYGAVVSGILKEENAAYAGNPAKCVKTGITWDSNGRRYGYIDNKID